MNHTSINHLFNSQYKWSQSVNIVRYYTSGKKSIRETIESQTKEGPVVVFMKGTKERPQCGFSRAVVEVLRREGLKDFITHNVLEDESLRQGIKEFSNWPTIPQVYIGGEFVGGCDIILEMHQDGSLNEKLVSIGVELEE